MQGDRVLLVDDDPFVLTGIGKELERDGYTVTSAENGARIDGHYSIRPAVILRLSSLIRPLTSDLCHPLSGSSSIASTTIPSASKRQRMFTS